MYVKNIREIRDFPGILENLKNQNSREFSSRESEMHTSKYYKVLRNNLTDFGGLLIKKGQLTHLDLN
jgi:predicted unusual protein kinase regulating ubiquinone biosynthesis (AarF/ABC1/UbiB family)